jgi:hypothetical protein
VSHVLEEEGNSIGFLIGGIRGARLGSIRPGPNSGSAGAASPAGGQVFESFDGVGEEFAFLVQPGQHEFQVDPPPSIDSILTRFQFEPLANYIFKL